MCSFVLGSRIGIEKYLGSGMICAHRPGLRQLGAPTNVGFGGLAAGGSRIRTSVLRNTTKVSRPPDVASPWFPATRNSPREPEAIPAMEPGAFRGTNTSNPASSSGESGANSATGVR